MSSNRADIAGGMTHDVMRNALKWMFTTAVQAEPTYTFSGHFGGELEGRGVGLPLARAYMVSMGGDLRFQHASEGTCVILKLGVTKDEDCLT